jgi:ubiquinone/menaquinone biosynthesis C-methylase UbiE
MHRVDAAGSSQANLTFEVDDAEKLNGIADQSIDLAICIGAFEHMLDKRAVS